MDSHQYYLYSNDADTFRYKFKSPFDPDVSQDQDLGRKAFHKFSYNFFSLVRTGVPLIFFKTVNPNQQVSFSSAGQGHFFLKIPTNDTNSSTSSAQVDWCQKRYAHNSRDFNGSRMTKRELTKK